MSDIAKISILLVDDHTMVREGLVALIQAQPDMEVLGQASDGEMAVQKAQTLRPQVVLMDISLPRLSGVMATTQLLRINPDIRVLAVSMHEEQSYLREMLDTGAAGYLVKRSAASELIRAVRIVARGSVYLDPTIAGKVVNQYSGKVTLTMGSDLKVLSGREEGVLRLVAQGYSNKEIAARLSLSIKTVETYKMRCTEKLGLDSRVDIVRFARDRGWLDDL